MIDVEELIAIPKIELHCHLDGSVSYEYLKRQAELQHIDIDFNKVSAKEECENLAEYLTCFDEILKVMQTKGSLTESVIDVANQAQKDGIKYIELRFASKFHTQKNMSIRDTLEAVCKGAEIAESEYSIMVRILVCGMKHHSNEENINIFKQIHDTELLKKYIVGVDLAGGEDDDSMSQQAEAIQYAKDKELNITLHAGECGCIKNIYDAVKMGAKRIGHGVALFNDKEQLNHFQNSKALLEICPRSNVQTKAISHIKEIDLDSLKRLNIPYLINTDNRIVTQTNLIKEYLTLLENNLITIEEIKRINKEAIDYAFINRFDKREILKNWD
ncbi:adenosine deaminase [Staphylococcus petrasii]|uniref:adenosine deaminase n=1 Tax=Staphylococcus petrasii TaxID=1276936 RepID=UPI001F5A342F|nr:adenosine deaminase [Staphylococcus petrasii]MCI2773598.1 adenosine deaminase [Staphylococcus petrasii]